MTGQPQGATSFGLTGNGSGFYGNTVGVKSGTAVQIGSGTFGDGFVGVDRLGRDIGGGSVGIRFGGASGTPGYGSISGDTIGDVDGPGILIQSGQASIQGNRIGVDANGGAHPNAGPGILSPGGDASAFTSQFGSSPFGHSSIGDPGYQCCYPPVNTTPNVISNSGGPAISIIGDENDDNAVGENLGQNNAGGFIDLGGDGPGNRTGVNHGISAPMIQGASLTHAYGRGNQFSLVFAYLSAPGPHGDLISVLGKIDKYNTAGHWEFDYPPQPPGTVLAFGSFGSEISYRTVDGNPPSTRIKVVQGKGRLTKVKLTASEANSSFTCRVDTGKPKACPGVLRLHLRPGRHRVAALATDASGNTAAKFVAKKFRVSH